MARRAGQGVKRIKGQSLLPAASDGANGRVPPNWTPAEWRRRLLYLAGLCAKWNPAKASELESWANKIELKPETERVSQ